jgi:hypothetical protein
MHEIQLVPRANVGAARTLRIPVRASSQSRTRILLDVRE